MSFRCSDIHETIIHAAVEGQELLNSKRAKAALKQSDQDKKGSARQNASEFIRGAALEKSGSVKKALKERLENRQGGFDDDELDTVMRLLEALDPVTSMLEELVTSLDRLLEGLMSVGRRKQRWVVDVRRGIEKARMELQHAQAAQGRLEALEAAERADGGRADVAKRLVEERVSLSIMLDNMLISVEDLSAMLKRGGQPGTRWVAGVRGELKNIQKELQRIRTLEVRLQELEEKRRIDDLRGREEPPVGVRSGPDLAAESSIDLA